MDHPTTDVLVDPDVAERLIAHIRNRTTDPAPSQLEVPAAHLVSKAHLAAEIALMKTLPLVVAHVSELKEAGDFVTRDVLGLPLIIVRQRSGEVAIFRNMCRHRGGVVEPAACGNKRSFMCQYHGWTYDAEGGGLNPVFYENTFGKIDYDTQGLVRIRTDVRYGFIFATLQPEADRDLVDYFGPKVDAEIDPWNLPKAVLYMEKVFTLPVNWKLVMDGAIDSLHAQFLHPKPGGVGSRTVNNTAVFDEYGSHGKMFMARSKLKRLLDAGEEVQPTVKHVGSILQLYPNGIYSNAPDHVEFWTVWPTPGNPSECTVKIRFFVDPDILTPEMEARIQKSWAILEDAAGNEDFPMEIAIQKNAEAWPETTLTYGVNEKSAQHLHRQLAKDLGRSV